MKKNIFLLLISSLLFCTCTPNNDETLELKDCEDCDSNNLPYDEDVLPDYDVPEQESPQIIVFMYHNLVYGRTGSIYNCDIYNFESELQYIRKNFKVIDFNDLLKINSGEQTLTTDAAIITFDDGDLSMYPLAFPLLRKYNFKATFFIVTSFVGTTGYMNWEQLAEINDFKNKQGINLFTIGSHTANHHPLLNLTPDEVNSELKISRETISEKLNCDVNFIALPEGSGADNEDIKNLVIANGYKAIRTSTEASIKSLPGDMYNLPGYNVENYSFEVFLTHVQKLLNR